MANNIHNSNKCIDDNDLETEDGEIDDRSSAEIKKKEDEIENYYLSLNELGCDLRCSCCGDVYSDPVKLKCQHLIDRSCAVIKKNGNIIECYQCHSHTECDDVDQLTTDFAIASRIPPKPDSLVAIINKHRGQLLQCNQEIKLGNLHVEDNNGDIIRPRKRKRKTRWDKIDNVPQTFNEAIMDILSSHNLSKNITISQFKKFTEISSKSSIMSLLTKAVLQSVNAEVQKRTDVVKGGSYSDTEILTMIPANELIDLFELEKIQFIMLYRDALDKGVILPPSTNKFSKLPLLPTPKSISNEIIKCENDLPPESHRKASTPELIDFDSPNKLSLTSSSIPIKCENVNQSDLSLNQENFAELLLIPVEKENENDVIILNEDPISSKTLLVEPKDCAEELPSNTSVVSPLPNDSHITEDSARYRDNVNRLHSIYSSMYLASVKMKQLENQILSTDYQSAHKIYSENYSEYQTLYSSLQKAISIDSVVTEKSDSVSIGNSSDNKHLQLSHNSSQTVVLGNCPGMPLSIVNGHEKQLSPSGNGPDLMDGTPQLVDKSGVSQNLPQYRSQIQKNNKNKFGYLWISNLCKDTKTNDLCKLFSKFGHVSKIKLFQYNAQSPVTYFSLIFMPNFSEAETAYRKLQNTTLFDRPISIKMLCPPIEIL